MVLAVVGVAALVIVVMGIVPFPHPFSFSTDSYYEEPVLAPSGSHVIGSFSTNNSDRVSFAILGSGMSLIYLAVASNGTFSFVSPQDGFEIQISLFGQTTTVHVSGQYSAPILFSPSFPLP